MYSKEWLNDIIPCWSSYQNFKNRVCRGEISPGPRGRWVPGVEGRAGPWQGRNGPPGRPAALPGGMFALGKQHLHQLLRSVADGSSPMGPSQSNEPARPHEAAKGSPERKGFLIKTQSQSEQILTTCNRIHLTSAKLNHVWQSLCGGPRPDALLSVILSLRYLPQFIAPLHALRFLIAF